MKRLPGLSNQISRLILWAVLVAWQGVAAVAQEAVDEDAMFSEEQTVVTLPSEEKTPALNKNYSFGLSGDIENVNNLSFSRSRGQYVDSLTDSDSLLLGHLYFDGRYQSMYKVFANLESSYTHTWEASSSGFAQEVPDDDTQTSLKEFFADTPIQNTVYLRWGKQVLQWGRCRLWNPTDLINVDKNTFIERIGSKTGVYGLKMHIPYGTKYNFYSFLDTGKRLDAQDLGGAVKFETLVGATEMAVSMWNKHDYRPVYGYDFSTRLFNVDVAGEASASKGSVRPVLEESNGVLLVDHRDEEWIPSASVNMAKDFRVGDQPDKLNLSTEFFYNGSGYDDSIFGDDRIYAYRDPVTVNAVSVTGGDKTAFLLGHGLYEPNYYAKYYVAFFSTVRNFITSDYSWSNNWVGNLVDGSSIYSTSLHYQNIKDWSADTTVYFFNGPTRSEYTLTARSVGVQLSVGYRF